MKKITLPDKWQKNLYAIIRAMNFTYRIRNNGRIKFRIRKKYRNIDLYNHY